MSERIQLLSSAFRDVKLSVGDLQLRPITAGSLDILIESGNPLFSESAGADDDSMLPMFEFIWVHSAPIAEVCEAAEVPGRIRHQARVLGMSLGYDDLLKFTVVFAELVKRLNASMTEAIPEGEEGKPAQSLTGSLLSSGTLGVPEIRSESVGSFGSYPSPEPTSTSTPERGITEMPADGFAMSSEEETPALPRPTLLPPPPPGECGPNPDDEEL